MSIQRYKLTQPIQTQSMVNQLPQGVAITLVGQSPEIYVDLDLGNDSGKTDLDQYMETLGWTFVETSPTSPRPVLAPEFQLPVIRREATPPVSPATGDRYIVDAGATGDWATHDDEIAEWDGTNWQFTAPVDGMTAWDQAEKEVDVYSGSWEPNSPRELGVFNAADAILTASNPPVEVVRNEREMLAYADSGPAVVTYFTGIVPRSYVKTANLRVRIYWVAATATTGDTRWSAAFEKLVMNAPNVDNDNFGTDKGVNTPTNLTNGVINSTIITFDNAEADLIAPGNPYRLRIRRQSGATGDTMVGDAQLMRVVIVQ